MSKKQKLNICCHDCSEETPVQLMEDEKETIIQYCPRCGSDNIELE